MFPWRSKVSWGFFTYLLFFTFWRIYLFVLFWFILKHNFCFVLNSYLFLPFCLISGVLHSFSGPIACSKALFCLYLSTGFFKLLLFIVFSYIYLIYIYFIYMYMYSLLCILYMFPSQVWIDRLRVTEFKAIGPFQYRNKQKSSQIYK